jgi:hypothetical protein
LFASNKREEEEEEEEEERFVVNITDFPAANLFFLTSISIAKKIERSK